MILNAIAEKLKRQSKDDFKGRHFEAWLIVQAVTWYLRYPLSYRDLEEMFRERGFEVDHSTINRWVLAYAPVIEKRLSQFRRPHCGSVRIDETYVRSGASGDTCTAPSTSTETRSTSCSPLSAISTPPSASSVRCSRMSRYYRRVRSAPMAPTRFLQRSRQLSRTGSCIQARYIMSPNISNKASRAITSE